ncbi:hypothetical protein COB55_03235 [Candidatus Wolfebacteria bacterium]|nr:MAG: hypothetical protein COB55_03235 [Candidatus Wolfebacteria bacterium]
MARRQLGFGNIRPKGRRSPRGPISNYARGVAAEPIDGTLNITAAIGEFDPADIDTVIIAMGQNLVGLSLTQKTGIVDGTPLMILFDQDVTGSRTATFDGADFQATLSTPLPTLSGTADTRDLTAWVWNESAAKYSIVAHSLEAIL